jgi:Ca-activated chloride channel family protein
MRRTTAFLAILGTLAGLVSCSQSPTETSPNEPAVNTLRVPRPIDPTKAREGYFAPGFTTNESARLGPGDLRAQQLHQLGMEGQRGLNPATEQEHRANPAAREFEDLMRRQHKQEYWDRPVAKLTPAPQETEELLILTRRTAGYNARPRGPEMWARQEQKMVPLPLQHTDVKAQVTVYVGAVTVTQQYHNPYDSKIEAVYVFPLPDDAAVNEFVMTVGDRKIRGIVREREEARQIYLEARRQGLVASLLEQDRPNIFTQKVANIEPGKRIDIAITYFHTLRQADGVFEFVFPMVVGPRYNPPGSADGVGAVAVGRQGASGQKSEVQYLPPDTVSSHDIALEVDVDGGTPIADLKSPTHVVDVKTLTPSRSVVTLGASDRHPNKDFVLRWKAAGSGVRAALATHRDETGGYFTMFVHPPETPAEIAPAKREMIFVLDCSGSMSGEPLAAAKRAAARCVRRLSPDDTFQIIRFSADAKSIWPAPVPATPENVRSGLLHLEALESESSTEMLHGIRAALGYPDSGRYRIVSFMTDGYIGNEAEILAAVERRLGNARIFSFGIGSSVNRYLIEGLGRTGRGVAHFVLPGDAGDKAADELYTRIERPALTDLRIDWGTMDAVEVHPSPLPDLYAGRPVVLTGRFKGDGPATVALHGKVAGQAWKSELVVNPATPSLRHRALAAVWARQKIASLHFGSAARAQSLEFAQEIKATALRYGLVSDYTSFVAVDSLTRTQGAHGTTVVQPVPVPAGVKYETTVERK